MITLVLHIISKKAVKHEICFTHGRFRIHVCIHLFIFQYRANGIRVHLACSTLDTNHCWFFSAYFIQNTTLLILQKKIYTNQKNIKLCWGVPNKVSQSQSQVKVKYFIEVSPSLHLTYEAILKRIMRLLYILKINIGLN